MSKGDTARNLREGSVIRIGKWLPTFEIATSFELLKVATPFEIVRLKSVPKPIVFLGEASTR